MKCNLLQRLLEGNSTQTLPTLKDWLNIFRPIKYEFKTSWHYRLILVLFIIISLIALGEMINIILHSSILLSWSNGLVVVAAVSVMVCFYLVLKYYDDTRPDSVLRGLLLGVILYPYRIIDEMRKEDFGDLDYWWILGIPIVCWLPTVGYFSTLVLLRIFPIPYVVIIWLTFLATCGILWWVGEKRDRQARNPLQGILEAKASSTSSKYLVSKSLFRVRGLRL